MPARGSALSASASDLIELADLPVPIRSVELTRWASAPHTVGRVSDPVGGWTVDAEVDAFVDRLIRKRPDQAADYDEAWIVIFAGKVFTA